MGELHRLDDPESNETVALKRLVHARPQDPDNFRRHFESLVRLEHAHLLAYDELLPEGEQTAGSREVLAFTEPLVDASDFLTFVRRPATRHELEELRPEDPSQKHASASQPIPERPSSESGDQREEESNGQSLADSSSEVVLEPADAETDEPDLLDVVLLRLERLIPQIVEALDHLHRFGAPHGNLKPTNVLVTDEGICGLTDYGLLPRLELVESAEDDHRPPSEEAIHYTRAYRAPETLRESTYSPAADLYSLGCMLFEAVTGCRPMEFTGDVEDSDYSLPSSTLSQLEPRCPPSWADLILRLLRTDPEDRPELDTVRELAATASRQSVDIPPSFVPEQESFFGRREIFDALVEDAERCTSDNRLSVSLLTGGAGYGKTAITGRLAQWASDRGWLILRGNCYQRDGLLYEPWDAIAGQLAEIWGASEPDFDDRTRRQRRKAGRFFDFLVDDDPSDAPLDRLDVVQALREILRTLARERPLLLLFDDLDAAGRDSAALLADLVASSDDFPCLVVGTWREAADGASPAPALADLQSAPVEVSWHRVRSFSTEEAEDYVESIADLTPAERDRVLETGENNPLLLEELLYQLHLERGTPSRLETDVESGPVAGPRIVEEIFEMPDAPVAEKLTRILEARLESLSLRGRFLVEILSVAELPIPGNLLSLMLEEEFRADDAGTGEFDQLLHRLRRLRIIREVDSHRWDRTFTLFHSLSSDLVVDPLPEQRLRHLFGHIADALRRLWPDAHELRFEFSRLAGRSSDAVDSALRAAREAESRFAHQRAARLWRWLTRRDETTRMSTLRPHEELARVERLAGRPAQAAELYHDLADDLPSGVPRAEMLLREFETRLEASHRREALAVLRQTGEMFDDHYRSPTLSDRVAEWKDRVVAATNRWSADLDQAVEDQVGGRGTLRLQMYRHILTKNDILDTRAGPRFRARYSAIAEKSRNALLLGYDRLFLAEACNIGGLYDRPERAREWFDEATPMFERANHGLGLARVEFGRARLAEGEGNFDDALERLDRAAEEFSTSEPVDQREKYLVELERARIALRRGELDRAVEISERVRHLYRGNELAGFRANLVLLGTFLFRAELADAEVLLDDSVAFLQGEVPCAATANLLHRRVKWNLRSGRPDVAEAEIEVHGDRLRRYGLVQADMVRFRLFLSRAQTHLAILARKLHLNEPRRQNHRKQARTDLDQLQRLESRLVPHLAAELDRTAAHLALLDDEFEQARRRAERSVSRLADYADPLARTLGVEVTGRVLEALPSEEGDELLAHCREVYDHFDCRAPLLLEGWPPLDSDSWLDTSDDEDD